MKNIYDLLNQAEDNENILSENERMEMTDIEKRRIYNRITAGFRRRAGRAIM